MSIPPVGPIAAASTWGARNGPRILRRIHDGGRTVQAALMMVLYAAFGALLTAAWVLLVLTGTPLLSLAFGLGALSAWSVTAEAVARWWWHPRASSGPVLGTAPSGTPATTWLRSGVSMVRPVGLLVVLVLCAAGELVASIIGDHPWGLAAPVVLLGLALWLALPILRGRVRAGGLHLTPAGIEHRWGASVTTVAWDDVRLLGPGGPFGLEGTPGLVHERGGWFMGDPVDQVRRPGVAIPLAYLPSPPGRVVQQVHEYAAHPALRPALGTPRSLDWYAARAADDG